MCCLRPLRGRKCHPPFNALRANVFDPFGVWIVVILCQTPEGSQKLGFDPGLLSDGHEVPRHMANTLLRVENATQVL